MINIEKMNETFKVFLLSSPRKRNRHKKKSLFKTDRYLLRFAENQISLTLR